MLRQNIFLALLYFSKGISSLDSQRFPFAQYVLEQLQMIRAKNIERSEIDDLIDANNINVKLIDAQARSKACLQNNILYHQLHGKN